MRAGICVIVQVKHRFRPNFNHRGHMPARMASPLPIGHVVPNDTSRHSRSGKAPLGVSNHIDGEDALRSLPVRPNLANTIDDFDGNALLGQASEESADGVRGPPHGLRDLRPVRGGAWMALTNS